MASKTFAGWAIDTDHVSDPGDPARVGVGQTAEELAVSGCMSIRVATGLRAEDVEDGIRFRLRDCDGELYYSGRVSRSWIEGDEEHAFAPLEYGTADAGATTLEYLEGRTWQVL